MKNIKDKKIIILILTLIIFTFGYFIIVNKISYAFENGIDIQKIQDKRVQVIEDCAVHYGKNHNNDFNDEGILYLTVKDLIDAGYLAPNEDGNLIDISNNEILNNKKIRIKKENDKIKAEIYS